MEMMFSHADNIVDNKDLIQVRYVALSWLILKDAEETLIPDYVLKSHKTTTEKWLCKI